MTLMTTITPIADEPTPGRTGLVCSAYAGVLAQQAHRHPALVSVPRISTDPFGVGTGVAADDDASKGSRPRGPDPV